MTINTAADGSSPREDVEFLARSAHRVDVLTGLAERSRDRSELRELTGASSPTIGRILGNFESRQWVVRRGHRYELTQLGEFVAERFVDLLEAIEIERKLRGVWQWFPTEIHDLPLELISGGVVTVADADDPYRPVTRFVSLLRETGRFRFVGSDIALISPFIDEICRLIVNGMQTEVIDPPEVSRNISSTYPEQTATALESGNFTLRWHDTLPPYGLGIFDDRIAISGHNPDNRTVQVLIDTDTPAAREWAESTYESYRREARPATSEPPAE